MSLIIRMHIFHTKKYTLYKIFLNVDRSFALHLLVSDIEQQ